MTLNQLDGRLTDLYAIVLIEYAVCKPGRNVDSPREVVGRQIKDL